MKVEGIMLALFAQEKAWDIERMTIAIPLALDGGLR